MVKKKTKRRPSGYNLFIKDCMNENKEAIKGQPFGAAGQIMKKCTARWKKMTEEEKNKYRERSGACKLNDDNSWECPI